MRKATWIQVNDFIIGDTLQDYKVVDIDEPLLPSSNITRTSVPSRNGQKVAHKGYNNKQVTVTIAIFGGNSRDINYKTGVLLNKIGINKEVRLIIGDSPHKYYRARIIDQCDYKDMNGLFCIEITFECSFCKYGLTGDLRDTNVEDATYEVESDTDITVNKCSISDINATTTKTIVNSGQFEALPEIVITGAASSVSISDGTREIKVLNISDEVIYLDCENMVAYTQLNSTKTSVLQRVTGNFIKLDVGNNTIVITVTGGSVDVQINYRNTYLI